jgi:AraC family transcriptional regulator, melibiose operon regulatory protein
MPPTAAVRPSSMRHHTFDHRRPDLTPYGFTCELWKGALMRRPDRHNEIELNLLSRGSLAYLLGGRRVTLREGHLGVFWAALPHQVIGSDGDPEYHVVTVPLAWFLQCRLPEGFVDGLLAGKFLSTSMGDRMVSEAMRCRQWIRDLGEGKGEPPEEFLLELRAWLLRIAKTMPAKGEGARGKLRRTESAATAGKAERMAGYIARHHQEHISVEDVAGHVGLHPNYAMTLFKGTFRTTLNEYLTHYRIAQAQRLLSTTDDKVVDVGLEAGFRTVSSFYEAFRKACGTSPSRFRKQQRGIR